ncbi:flagellar M-ring protein [Xylanibacillus composti]|uniref:Flagellar M-ring protein n=1 Tax=Xylanibacillus composti TaxID=1572762 RepID=A0A8J4M279_9BACL|nr:flagellar basal-body MS-ring/collar protein FliF [Xylanibacillus composti]GIQ68647.1 flagellar M-ring protein [Xylanibacillus composti]
MNEALSRYRDKTKQFWNRMDIKQKVLSVSIVVLTVLVIALVIFNFSKTEYSWAFRDLDATDMAAVKDYLESTGIPYKFGPDGSSIAVPTTEVTRVKVEAASQDLVQNGSQGFGIFKDNISSFGMTDNQFAVLKDDALAGEIQKQINTKEGVVSSKVLLAMPESSVFISDNREDKASASVSINFRPGYRASQEYIDSLYNIVRLSVGSELLPIENITITDQKGELLPSSKLNGGIGNTANVVLQQMQIKKEYEEDIRRNIESFLGTILGSEKVVVSVVSSLNFDQRAREERLFQPVNTEDQTGIARSVQEIQKNYTNTGANEGGVPGTGAPDVPGYQGNMGQGESSSEEISSTINYEINEITQSIISSPYVVTDLTIFAGIEPPDPQNPDSLSQEVKDEIEQMLVGIVNTSLADSGRSFTTEELQGKVSVITQNLRGVNGYASDSSGGGSNALFYGIGAAVLAAIAALAFFVMRRRRAAEVEEEFEEDVAAAIEQPTIDLESVRNENQVKKQLESLAKKKPEEFVNLLRTWLAEE